MGKVISYISDVRSELAKVVWPKRQEVVKLTTTVIIISVAVGAYLGALDFVFAKLLENIVTK